MGPSVEDGFALYLPSLAHARGTLWGSHGVLVAPCDGTNWRSTHLLEVAELSCLGTWAAASLPLPFWGAESAQGSTPTFVTAGAGKDLGVFSTLNVQRLHRRAGAARAFLLVHTLTLLLEAPPLLLLPAKNCGFICITFYLSCALWHKIRSSFFSPRTPPVFCIWESSF